MASDHTRRKFCLLCLAATTVLGCPAVARARKLERSIAMRNFHTGESVKTVYWANGHYLKEALSRINFVLRDFRTEEVHEIDTKLIDLLHKLKMHTGTRKPFHVISGYRSPETNTMLRKTTNGVAKNSFHLQGKAVDVYLPDYDVGRLRRAAMSFSAGGVGYYPESGFIHVDTGPVRYW